MPSLAQRSLAEGLGTAFLLAAVVGSGIMAAKLAGGNGALALLCDTLPTGAILTVLILIFGPLSGVSLAFALRGELPWPTSRPWRDQPGYPIEQRGSVARHSRRWRECSRIIGRDAIDDCEACVAIGAVAGVDTAVNRSGEDNATSFLQRGERIAPRRIVGRQIRAGDGDEPTTIGKTYQSRGDMA